MRLTGLQRLGAVGSVGWGVICLLQVSFHWSLYPDSNSFVPNFLVPFLAFWLIPLVVAYGAIRAVTWIVRGFDGGEELIASITRWNR